MDGMSETTNNITKKRSDYLEWHEYFMAIAFITSKRSKDPVTQVGACIVNQDKLIVSTGYNGMPKGCSDDEFPWGKESDDELDTKYMYVCHAEVNAVLNRNSADLRNCTLYTTLFPCSGCAKTIIQAGVREVIYMNDKYAAEPSTIASKRMFDASGVQYWQYVPKRRQLIIDFGDSQSESSEFEDNTETNKA